MVDNSLNSDDYGQLIYGQEASGTAVSVAVDYRGQLITRAQDSSLDAFGRIRVSDPFTVFESKLINSDDAPLLWDEQISAGAATTPTEAKPYIDMSTSLDTNSLVQRQTFRRFNYQPGKSQKVVMTGVLDLSGGGSGINRFLGVFDANNGLFFHDAEGTINIVVRSNDSGTPVDTSVAQSDWSVDTMDGNGPSGVNVDWTKAQLFVFDFEWLSIGRVRIGLEIDGIFYTLHEHNTANSSAVPWCSTPNLPLRYAIDSGATGAASSMRCICSTVVSEGGADPVGLTRYRSTEGAALTTATADVVYAMIGLKLKTTHFGTTINFKNVALQLQTASEYLEWSLRFNPTVADTFTYANLTNSSVQTALGGTLNVVTGGTQIAGGFAETGTPSIGGSGDDKSLDTTLHLGSTIAGTADAVVLCIRPVGGVAVLSSEGSLSWQEL